VSATAGGSAVATVLDPNKVSPGLLGFIIVVIIGIAVWFLARSMAKQLRKLDGDRIDDPEQGEADGAEADGAEADGAEAEDAEAKDTAPTSAASKDTASKDTASNGAH